MLLPIPPCSPPGALPVVMLLAAKLPIVPGNVSSSTYLARNAGTSKSSRLVTASSDTMLPAAISSSAVVLSAAALGQSIFRHRDFMHKQ